MRKNLNEGDPEARTAESFTAGTNLNSSQGDRGLRVWTTLASNGRTIRIGTLVLVAAALLMIGYRFLNLGLSPFVLDEPQILRASYEQIQTGEWRSASPLLGTQGVPYGPSAFWFYGAVQWFFGLNPVVSILAMCVILSVSHVILAGALAKAFNGGWLLFATLLGWIASSPYLFFWSRLAWDQLVIVCSSAAVGLIAQPRVGWVRATTLGLVLGIGLSSHPMILPLIVVIFLSLIIGTRWTHSRKGMILLATVVLGLILVNIPYVLFLAHSQGQSSPVPEPSIASSFNQFLGPARVATPYGISYLFEGAWEDFLAFTGAAGHLFRRPLPVLVFAIAVSVPGMIAAIRSPAEHQRVIGYIGLLTWVGYAFAYGFFGIYPHAHYQFPTWWIISVGLAGTLWSLWERNRLVAVCVGVAVWLVTFVQFSFLVSWVNYIRAREGTQGINYSVPLDVQKSVIKKACSVTQRTISIEDYTFLFPQSLEYLALSTKECREKRVYACEPMQCLASSPTHRLFRLTYSRTEGGAVTLE
jgi:hypothetical protein